MTALSLGLAALALLAWGRLAWLGVRTDRALLRLDGPPPAPPFPSVTAVVPCRDEAAGVEHAVRSLLAQDLPGLQIVAVDDRSRDGTGEILERLRAGDPRLDVVHVVSLPDGWLGKNHACAVGARRARGEWLLFTDGDVVFAPDAIRRAVALARAHGLGHLALAPRLVAPGFAERAFVTAFAALLSPALRAWELSRAGTRGYVGMGAFNLVRRDAYERAGGHARIALEVLDDLKLGLLLRRSGVPQGAGLAGARVRVRWYHGLVASVVGLVKNAFAAAEYRPGSAALSATVGAFLGAAPLALALLAPTVGVRAIALAALALSVVVHGVTARGVAGGSGAEGLLMPACAILLSGIALASAASAFARGGVVWRGTHYRLADVREGCLRAADLPASGAVGWSPERPPRAAVR